MDSPSQDLSWVVSVISCQKPYLLLKSLGNAPDILPKTLLAQEMSQILSRADTVAKMSKVIDSN